MYLMFRRDPSFVVLQTLTAETEYQPDRVEVEAAMIDIPLGK